MRKVIQKQKISHFLFSLPSEKSQTKGAMEISFGMIFSIILIIIFIAFAIYGITKFLNLQKEIQTKTFIDNLNFDIDKLWKSQGSQSVTYSLPGNAEKICFSEDNLEKDLDLEIKGKTFIQPYDIKHAKLSDDFSKGSGGNCISVEKGKINLQLEKNYGKVLVTINKAG